MDARPETTAYQPPHPLVEFIHHFRQNSGAVLGFWIIVLFALLAIFADVVAPHPPAEQYRDALLRPPVWLEGGSTRFLLGTDDIGRDMLSRLIYGARVSMAVGFNRALITGLGMYVAAVVLQLLSQSDEEDLAEELAGELAGEHAALA